MAAHRGLPTAAVSIPNQTSMRFARSLSRWPTSYSSQPAKSLILLAALAPVVIASCYDGDTCTTTTGERLRLACIDTPEQFGKRAKPVPAGAARDHLRGLVVGKKFGIRRITEDRYGRTVAELFLGETNVQQEMVATGHAEIYRRYAYQCPWARRN